MSVVVTLRISEETAHQAEVVAASTQRPVEDVLADWLNRSATEIPVDQLPDDEVRALADLQMPDDQQEQLSELLDLQREGELTDTGRAELDTLMQIYRRGLVRKSQAIKVAVERGLMQPLG